jgi:CheY-like chemotaxis protein
MQESLAQLKLANDVLVVRDGAEALSYLSRTGSFAGSSHRNPVVVLLDIKMPKVDGIQVLAEMKANSELKLIPVVMLTSSRESSDLTRCYSLGANAYVVKPMKFGEFVDVIRQVGVFWALVNEASR